MTTDTIAPSKKDSGMQRDNEVFGLIRRELERQRNGIELIASENFASAAAGFDA